MFVGYFGCRYCRQAVSYERFVRKSPYEFRLFAPAFFIVQKAPHFSDNGEPCAYYTR
jgi:hypothetical protein